MSLTTGLQLNPNMIMFPNIGWLRARILFQVPFAAQIVCLSRGLLLVVAFELISMPVTQDLWTWDKFLHGGQDFELGLLMIVTCLCLTLLRAEQSRCDLGFLVAMWTLIRNKCARGVILLLQSAERGEHRPRIPLSSPTQFANIPLLI